MQLSFRTLAIFVVASACQLGLTAPLHAALEVSPTVIELDRPEGSQQILVTLVEGDRRRDVTRQSAFTLAGPAVVGIDANGLVLPKQEGEAQLVVKHGATEAKIPVRVTGQRSPPPVSFQYEIIPILTKGRCNSGGCHGKNEGQNGFKLSLLGFDAAADYDALIKEARGRRISIADPPSSLLLRKGAAETPHGGGMKIESTGFAYHRLKRWIAGGAPFKLAVERPIVGIVVEPPLVTLQPGDSQQLRVTAIDADGNRRCATAESDFISNAPHVVEADSRGLLQSSKIPGEAAILVRYLGHVAVARISVPRGGTTFARPAEANFIDKHVWDKLVRLGIQPSTHADDAVFLRRAYLDVIGTLPTADEARKFLADTAPNETREKLVDELLARPEYANYWAMKWANLLRADKLKVTPQGTVAMTRWLKRQFTENRPYDAMVHDILTAQGPVQADGAASFFKALDQPELASRSVSQLFLGVRIECAQCHHHPSERWGQDDYAGLVGFFTGVSVKKLPGGGDAVVAGPGTDKPHPRTGEIVPARALGAADAVFDGVIDRRQVLADWMTKTDNPFFARAIVNRLWAHYFGRGLVEPIDDIRATNPPTNEPLMAALEAHLKSVRYDLKAFTRTLLASNAYQLSEVTNESNVDDRQNFSHASPKALAAEVLLDAMCQVTGVPEKFNGWPIGVRSIEVWDNRMPSYFFRIFGRPVRATVCECERSNEPSISQALHLLNSPEINEKLADRHGVARKLARSSLGDDAIIDEIYLSTLSRFATAEEKTLMKAAFEAAGPNRRQAVEDILWAVLNTKDFLYNH